MLGRNHAFVRGFVCVSVVLAGCAVVVSRLQPHTSVQTSVFDVPSPNCAGQPIVFDVTYDRSEFIGEPGVEGLSICDTTFSFQPALVSIGPASGTDCGGGPRGVVKVNTIVVSYDYLDEDKNQQHEDLKYACPAGTETLDMGGNPALAVSALGVCAATLGTDTGLRDAMNRKPARIRIYGTGECAPELCVQLKLDMSLAMSAASVATGEECKQLLK
jgi:hypothetical protein